MPDPKRAARAIGDVAFQIRHGKSLNLCQNRTGLTIELTCRRLRIFRNLRDYHMVAISATEFAKSFGRYKEEAQREPVAITSYGRVSGYFVSAQEYEELQRLRVFERRVYRLKELPKEILDGIKSAKMDPSHDHLNALLDDK